MVVIYSNKLFHIQRALSMVLRLEPNKGNVLRKVSFTTILSKTVIDFSNHFRTKLQFVCTPTQGIVNIDVINKTIPEKKGNNRGRNSTFYFFKHRCIGFVCGMMNNLKKIKIQPLNMVFK